MTVLGKIRQLIHYGPILALFIIFFISLTTIKCVLMYWPLDYPGGVMHFLVFLLWNFLTLYNYFLSAFKGPGFVPLEWRPTNPEHMKKLQYCELCECYKTPRSHHCRKCDRCVMKMDHHCPWINTCVGHFNHANFTYFLFFAPCGCIHTLFILIPSIYRAINFTWYLHYGDKNPLVYLTIWGLLATMFAIGLSIGVIIAVWMLFIIQMKSIIKNETGIESWIIDKAQDREREEEEEGEFIYPYNLGCWENIKQVFTWSGKPKSDGFTWDVVQGCDQFTLTEEQLQQKALKRDRTVEYVIVEDYSGALIPLSKGCGMCCGIPCTDEPRIALRKGDIVKVTRWKKKWLYGTKERTNKYTGGFQLDYLHAKGQIPYRSKETVQVKEDYEAGFQDDVPENIYQVFQMETTVRNTVQNILARKKIDDYFYVRLFIDTKTTEGLLKREKQKIQNLKVTV